MNIHANSVDRVQDRSALQVVYAQYVNRGSFSWDLFEGYTSLRALTYSASIPTLVRMLDHFHTVECVFGYEDILSNFAQILGAQKVLIERLNTAIKTLEDPRKMKLVEAIAEGRVRFFVVRNAISHSKLYLLEGPDKQRVMAGSPNLSERAFSGYQHETLMVFDNDMQAWEAFLEQYDTVKALAYDEISTLDINLTEIPLEKLPLVQQADQDQSVTVFTNLDIQRAEIPSIIHKVERFARRYQGPIKSLVQTKKGQIQVTRQNLNQVIHLSRTQKLDTSEDNSHLWLTVDLESGKMIFSGEEIPLAPKPALVQSDVSHLIEYFENFRSFHGDPSEHQRTYFMFMAWFFASPFICDFRNRALLSSDYLYDCPVFAALYGKSNCGKTKLIETLMRSMFGGVYFIDKQNFTRSFLRDLRLVRRRFPVVFDDIEKDQFKHAADLIKDDFFSLDEYPGFVLSMNADEHSFPTETKKRGLILHTTAALPDNRDVMKPLHRSVSEIQKGISTNLYQEYVRRVLTMYRVGQIGSDILDFSSTLLVQIFSEVYPQALPAWCMPVTMKDYDDRKYDKIRNELCTILETSRHLWEIQHHKAILRVPTADWYSLRRDIPSYLLLEGSKAGTIVMNRKELEKFLKRPLSGAWIQRLFRR